MYADPQSLTISGTAVSLPRQGTASPDKLGRFVSADGLNTFEVRQNNTQNRFRREVRLTTKKTAADPINAVNKEVSASVIITIDEPRWGFTDAELGAMSSALLAWFTAANRDKLLGGEN